MDTHTPTFEKSSDSVCVSSARELLRQTWPLWTTSQRAWFRALPQSEQEALVNVWCECLSDCRRWSLERTLAEWKRQVNPFDQHWEYVGQLWRERALGAERARRAVTRQLSEPIRPAVQLSPELQQLQVERGSWAVVQELERRRKSG